MSQPSVQSVQYASGGGGDLLYSDRQPIVTSTYGAPDAYRVSSDSYRAAQPVSSNVYSTAGSVMSAGSGNVVSSDSATPAPRGVTSNF